jgi:hypothetical protein
MSHKGRSHGKIDKTVISTVPLFDKSDVKHYWHSRSPQERLEYMEILRRTNYGNKAAARLQRVFELVEKAWR